MTWPGRWHDGRHQGPWRDDRPDEPTRVEHVLEGVDPEDEQEALREAFGGEEGED